MSENKMLAWMGICVPLFLILLYFLHPIPFQNANSDMGEHLLLGKIIYQTKSLPHTNLLSFTFPSYPFINTTWLSDVFFYLLSGFFGYNGLILFSVSIITIAFLFLSFTAWKRSDLFTIVLACLLYFPILSQRTQVRPEEFSYLFLSLSLFLLYRYKKKFTKLVFLLIPLEILWVNMHIYFITGVIVTGLFLVDVWISHKKSVHKKEVKTLFLVFLLTLFSTAVNPQGVKILLYPLFVFSNYGMIVVENANFFTALLQYFDVTFVYYGCAIVFLWVMLLIFIKKIEKIDIVLSLFFSLLGLYAIRNSGLFVFGTFIPFCHVSYLAIKDFSQKFSAYSEVSKLVLFSILFAACLYSVYFSLQLQSFGLGVTDQAKEPVDFMIHNQITGPIYNNYNIGSYLEYRLYPTVKVFVDGRPEAYPKEFFDHDYYPMETSYGDFQRVDKKYHFNSIFYEHLNQTENQHQLLLALTKSPEWKIVYLDSYSVIFLRNNKKNKDVIQKYEITPENVTIRKTDFDDKVKVGNMSNFFRVVEWWQPMVKMDFRYLDFDPNSCISLRHIAAFMQQTNDPLKDIYTNRYTTTCLSQQ